ncbi:hypothetical protein COW46_02975 [Candidatus Gracilibacteria bacterium CG17_big_fil_post_rev_8_21_14_2_50_48_13]|nr:MAG: hypothetical protein COW46_02975 [Candidatus Gracilibacteria bacterium CG17_big_fil_post_rev_8_21_14_2_50_48_13]
MKDSEARVEKLPTWLNSESSTIAISLCVLALISINALDSNALHLSKAQSDWMVINCLLVLNLTFMIDVFFLKKNR